MANYTVKFLNDYETEIMDFQESIKLNDTECNLTFLLNGDNVDLITLKNNIGIDFSTIVVLYNGEIKKSFVGYSFYIVETRTMNSDNQTLLVTNLEFRKTF